MNLSDTQRIVFIRMGKIILFAAAVFAVTKINLEFETLTRTSTAAFSFLIIVLLSAFFGDIIIAIIISFTAALCFDYFYLPPSGTLNIAAFADWISLATFLLASIIISYLTASASENKKKANILIKTMNLTKEFGKSLLSLPQDKLTLSGIAEETLTVFSLEYCSIHVYGRGKWQHFSGTATSEIPKEIESKLKYYQDHPTDLNEIADENISGVKFMVISRRQSTLALMAVKSRTLPVEAIGAIAYMIGICISAIMKD